MIKVEAFVNNRGNIEITVTSSDASKSSLDELDLVYKGFMMGTPRKGAYPRTNEFIVEVKPEPVENE